MGRTSLTKAGIGLALIGIPVTIGLASISSDRGSKDTPPTEIYQSSRYLKEKGHLDCGNSCPDLSSGYKWAKSNNVCDAKYNKNESKAYNLGVQARAWDDCAYSENGKPI